MFSSWTEAMIITKILFFFSSFNVFSSYARQTWIPSNRHKKMALEFFSKNLTLAYEKKLYNHIKVITVSKLKFCYIVSKLKFCIPLFL